MRYKIVKRILQNRNTIGYQLLGEDNKIYNASKQQVKVLLFQLYIVNAKLDPKDMSIVGKDNVDLRTLSSVQFDELKNNNTLFLSEKNCNLVAHGCDLITLYYKMLEEEKNKKIEGLIKEYHSKYNVNGNPIVHFTVLDSNHVRLDSVVQSYTGKIVIPEFVTEIYNSFLGANANSAIKNALDKSKSTEIYIENLPNQPFDASYLCQGMNSDSIKISFRHPECVTNVEYMFSNCNIAKKIDLTNMNLQNCKSTRGMFEYCALMECLRVNSLNTENIEDMSTMFKGCRSLKSLDISMWNKNKVKNIISMFNGCTSLEFLKLGVFPSELGNLVSVFLGCRSLRNLDLRGLNCKSVSIIHSLLEGCKSLQLVVLPDLSSGSLTTMSAMFKDCESLIKINFAHTNTCNVSDFAETFKNCKSLSDLDLSMFDTSNCVSMFGMFEGCKNLKNIGISSFNTSKVRLFDNMFKYCSSLIELDLSHFESNSLNSAQYMFMDCKSLKHIDLSGFDKSKIFNSIGMFMGTSVEIKTKSRVVKDELNSDRVINSKKDEKTNMLKGIFSIFKENF